MKTTRKKRKNRGSRNPNRSKPEPKIISAPKSGTVENEAAAKQKSNQVVSKKTLDKKPEIKKQGFKFLRIANQFLRDSKMELKKVKWPTRKELLASTAVVLLLVIVVAFFLGIIDFALIKIIKNIVG